jgi:hypothetical protein
MGNRHLVCCPPFETRPAGAPQGEATPYAIALPQMGKVPEGRKGDVEDRLPLFLFDIPFRQRYALPPSPSGGR